MLMKKKIYDDAINKCKQNIYACDSVASATISQLESSLQQKEIEYESCLEQNKREYESSPELAQI